MDELGIPQLDTILAPVPGGASVLFANDPGVEAEPFLYQVAGAQAAAGREVLYMVTSRPPEAAREAMEEYDLWSEEGVAFVDAYTPRRGVVVSEAADHLEDPGDPTKLAGFLEDLAADHPDAVLVVEDLSTLVDADPEAFTAAVDEIAAALDRFGLTVAQFTRWPYEQGDVDRIEEGFDALVRIRSIEGRIVLSQYFMVERAAWRDEVDGHPRLFKPLRPGGIYVYVPKIAVTGPYNAGKSTFIHSVSDRAISVDRLGTTVALDHGHAKIDGIATDLFGTPGQTRFDPILETLSRRGLGLIVLVDASKPESFERAREMLERMWRFGLPAVVVANKQDLPNALGPDEVRERLRPPREVEVVDCIGQEPDSARWVLRRLLDRILASGIMVEEGGAA